MRLRGLRRGMCGVGCESQGARDGTEAFFKNDVVVLKKSVMYDAPKEMYQQ